MKATEEAQILRAADQLKEVMPNHGIIILAAPHKGQYCKYYSTILMTDSIRALELILIELKKIHSQTLN